VWPLGDVVVKMEYDILSGRVESWAVIRHRMMHSKYSDECNLLTSSSKSCDWTGMGGGTSCPASATSSA
jgi:hypothetical protein